MGYKYVLGGSSELGSQLTRALFLFFSAVKLFQSISMPFLLLKKSSLDNEEYIYHLGWSKLLII